MSKSTRRLLFYTLILAFLLLGTGILLFSQGYRLELSTLTLEKVGGIYIRSFPANANIEVDGQPVKNNSWFLQSGTLINGLFPHIYRVRLSLPGYRDWHQTAVVQPALVTEFPTAVLIPDTLQGASTSTNAQNLWMAGGRLLLADGRGNIILGDTAVASGTVLSLSDDEDEALVFQGSRNAYTILNLENGQTIPVTTVLQQLGVGRRVKFSATLGGDGQTVLIKEARRLLLVDLATPRATVLENGGATSTLEQVDASSIYIAWSSFNKVSGFSKINVYDKVLGRVVGSFALDGRTTKLAWATRTKLGVLQDHGGLAVYDVPGRQMRQLATEIKDFEFSPNGELVAAKGTQSLELISLEEPKDYWKFHRMPGLDNIKKITWYRDNRHAFLHYADSIKFLDFRDRLLEHFDTLETASVAAYDSELNRIYFAKEGRITSLEFAK